MARGRCVSTTTSSGSVVCVGHRLTSRRLFTKRMSSVTSWVVFSSCVKDCTFHNHKSYYYSLICTEECYLSPPLPPSLFLICSLIISHSFHDLLVFILFFSSKIPWFIFPFLLSFLSLLVLSSPFFPLPPFSLLHFFLRVFHFASHHHHLFFPCPVSSYSSFSSSSSSSSS